MPADKKNKGKQTEPAGPNDEASVTEEGAPVKAFPIVGIGASAGGLAAFEAFFSAMPPVVDTDMAFVLIQHLSPDHKSALTELVRRYTRMPVEEVEDGVEVKPNQVYIIPPNRDLALLNGRLQLFEPDHARGVRLTIDFFFRSLAADQHHRAICIVLSGTGSDGTVGVRAVKGEGGMAMAQTPATTEFDGMPRSAIATGLIDYILSPGEMAAQLVSYARHSFDEGLEKVGSIPGISRDVIAKVCVLLRARTGRDFSQYKESTMARRVERRMTLQQITKPGDYLRFLQQTGTEIDALFRDLLIGVTTFFRDPAFATLESIAIPKLFEGLAPDTMVRVWVCGCSTGEEAYSIAIVVREYLDRIGQSFKLQIFATDIDRRATEQARTGLFNNSITADVSPDRLERFFTREAGGTFRIQKAIRDQVIFSEQDVLQDPPFSKMHLISCRNLLIYLNAEVQRRIMPLFHYALNAGGILFLGNSETIGDHTDLFETLDRKAKIYLRKEEASARRTAVGNLTLPLAGRHLNVGGPTETSSDAKINFRMLTEQAILKHRESPGVLINGHGEILYFHGRTGHFLEPEPGDVSANIFGMIREGLRHEFTMALQQAVAKKTMVEVNDLHLQSDGKPLLVNLTIMPVSGPATARSVDLFAVLMEERRDTAVQREAKPSAEADAGDKSDVRVTELQRELSGKDEYIHRIIEEMATSSEELKSSYEELQSVNEEMQSTNEELETSKEELQSVNEELTTVNAELVEKVADLSRANNDMNNLLSGTGVGTLFVDHHICITRYTPAVTRVINLIPGDTGRPLSDLVPKIMRYDRLIPDVQGVLETLMPKEVEVQTHDGNWYLLSIRPYRTLDNVIEGAVITFVNVTERKAIEQKLREAERFRIGAGIATVGIVFYAIDGAMSFANEAFLAMYGYEKQTEMAGTIWATLTPAEWMRPFKEATAELRASGHSTPYERQYLRKDGTKGWGLFAGQRISEKEAVEYVVDMSRTKKAEGELEEAREGLRQSEGGRG